MYKQLTLIIIIGIISSSCIAQTALQTLQKGIFSGSFESYAQLYKPDSKINAVLPQDRFAANNYLKLDYAYSKFSLGLQYENYAPAIAGFPFVANEGKVVNKYFKYTDKNFAVQIGDFYEQLGSGLVFRAWENRQIGINNALNGVNVYIKPTSFLAVKALYGKPRKVLDYADASVRAADATIDITDILKSKGNTNITTGISYVSRYQQYTGPDPDFPATVQAYAARLNVNSANTNLSVEYVSKGKDPHDVNNQSKATGQALLVNAGYTIGNLGINAVLRSMANMDFRSERDAFGTQLPVNFVPALTKQHDFLATNIYVYNPQAMGETGGQVDIYYYCKPGSLLGGKYGVNIAANAALYYGLKPSAALLSVGDEKYFHDYNIEVKKKWNKKWQTTFGYYQIFYNKSVIEGSIIEPSINSNIFVLNTQYKYSTKKSARVELQHLGAREDKGNWAAALLELTYAPTLSVYVSDLYNYDKTNTHYFNFGGAYTKKGTRFGASYGRQRAGLYCAGGVCRFVPAATGFTATLTTTFNN